MLYAQCLAACLSAESALRAVFGGLQLLSVASALRAVFGGLQLLSAESALRAVFGGLQLLTAESVSLEGLPKALNCPFNNHSFCNCLSITFHLGSAILHAACDAIHDACHFAIYMMHDALRPPAMLDPSQD